jgi:hypothetical protein
MSAVEAFETFEDFFQDAPHLHVQCGYMVARECWEARQIEIDKLKDELAKVRENRRGSYA